MASGSNAATSTTWKWRARAETSGTTINVAGLAIVVLQLEATPAAVYGAPQLLDGLNAATAGFP